MQIKKNIFGRLEEPRIGCILCDKTIVLQTFQTTALKGVRECYLPK